MSWRPDGLRAGEIVLVVAAVAAAVWAGFGLKAAHADAQEAAWIAHHTRTGSYHAVELGEQRADGSAEAVWVTQPGGPEAFVDLTHSKQQVDAVGQQVRARIDNRDAPATGEGIAADAVGRSFAADYAEAGWPLLVTVVAAGLAVALERHRRRTVRRTSR